ncbi:tRNA uridine-5-carboxymethylaminomethyl(34) synthesis GTPase MnmE [Lutibacter sp. A64]|uniref:tRNA uridine-5-carboxymethylaminomethyl(34) synthesis GTPase MnmE n=1 Tax=Lutibacter sp. A64 TaxID=2918526 RepID=UPI001F0507B9|nr:tRNA uridine-5-carboxymethylaminomethyl(34) synthesis GTPase MnmE [Lutibacter sp. A64]UMB54505.1 tRNA uridine-5-carboxymethylaminomethyl(34) synthesis GTPase MnmE [Lutibacter sp. A64]
MNAIKNDTIIALATSSGVGAIAVIRLSGEKSIEIVNKHFKSKFGNKDLNNVKSHTIHLGNIIDNKRIIDEVLISVFKNPNSYTGENVVEINCHGSVYIQQEIIQLFIKSGVRNADAGEFTLRAFLNGKMDLSQAEAVADLIASNSAASHQVALQQMRGGFSSEIEKLRQQLLNFASLIELELDFAEEDVEFADRTEFSNLINQISAVLKQLIDSFALGNVLKNGIPIAIVGEPNVGKSTLLNALLNEEKAIVSHIAGTTRDAIEDEINIEGIAYRFIDTAGIRTTEDYVENIGITKTFSTIEKAQLVLQLIDASNIETLQQNISELEQKYPSKKILTIVNKSDLLSEAQITTLKNTYESLIILSAKNKIGIHKLTTTLTQLVNKGALSNNETIVSNSRHFEALNNAYLSIKEVQKGIENNISTDLFAIDIRQALFHLGEITGEVTTEDLLGNIFANFCIGK